MPACAATVDAVEEHRAKAKAEHLGMDARPAAHDIMAVFMHRDDDRQRNDKGANSVEKIAEIGEKLVQIHILMVSLSRLPCGKKRSVSARPKRRQGTRLAVCLHHVIKVQRDISKPLPR